MAEYLFQKPAQLSSYNVLDIAKKQQEEMQKLAAAAVKANAKKKSSIDSSLMKELNSLNASNMYAPDKKAMQLYEQELDNILFNEDLSDPYIQRYFGKVLNNAVNHMDMAKTVYEKAEKANEDKPEFPSFMNMVNVHNTGMNPWGEDGMVLDTPVEDLTSQRSQRNTVPDMTIDRASGAVLVNSDNGPYPRIEDPLFQNPSYKIQLGDMRAMSPSDYAEEKKAYYNNLESEEQVRKVLLNEINNNQSLARQAALSQVDRDGLRNKERVDIALSQWVDETVDLLYKADEMSDAERGRYQEREQFLQGTTAPDFQDIANVTTNKGVVDPKDYEMSYQPVDLEVALMDPDDPALTYPAAQIHHIVIADDGSVGVIFSSSYNTDGVAERKMKVLSADDKDLFALKAAINSKYGVGTFQEMFDKSL